MPTFYLQVLNNMAKADKLESLLEPVIEALGYELLGVMHLSQGSHSLLRIYIDSEQGIMVEDCEKVSRQVSALLDVEDPIAGNYSLEVSSPGMDRPLFKPAHYERFLGQTANIHLRRGLDGRRKFKGVMKTLQDNELILEMDGQEYRLPFDDIEKANLVPEYKL